MSGRRWVAFCVNYASMLLVPPEDHVVLQPGDRLRAASGAEAWWPAASYEQADASMRQVADLVSEQALPFFEATRSASGLYAQLSVASWASEHHLELARGACLAWVGDGTRAREHLARAVALYDQDGRDWCAQYRSACADAHGRHRPRSTRRAAPQLAHGDRACPQTWRPRGSSSGHLTRDGVVSA